MTAPLPADNMLRDIHLPDAVSWWPPAIGWWILLALLLLAIYLLPKLYRYLTFKPLSRVCQEEFENIKIAYNKQQDLSILIQSISKLLRQISMSFHGRDKVANLTGDAWINSLNDLTEENYFQEELKNTLINAPYQKNINIDARLIIDTTQDWIDNLPKKSISGKQYYSSAKDSAS